MLHVFTRVRFAATVLGLVAVSTSSHAAVITSPGSSDGVSGGNVMPYSMPLGHVRYQQIYAAADFAAEGKPLLITRITHRLTPEGSPFLAHLPDVEIRLSTTTKAVDGLAATFADNVGPNDTVVHSGTLTLTSPGATFGTDAQPWDVHIDLQTPFVYDPSQGNLLLDVRNKVGAPETLLALATIDRPTDTSSRAFTLGWDAPTATTVDSLALETMFTATPIPEPTIAAAVALLAPALLATRRKRNGDIPGF